MKGKNLRDMKVSTDTGKDVTSTKKLSGEASPTAAWKAKNDTSQYTTGKTATGPLGGENSNS